MKTQGQFSVKINSLGLLGDAALLPAHSQHIVVVNRSDTAAALERAEFAA